MHIRKLPLQETDAYDGRAVQWTIFAAAEQDGTCQVENFLLEQLNGPLAGVATQFLAFLDSMVYDEQGPRRWIDTARCHESVAGEQIYEFRLNRLRVHWFYGVGRSVAILAVGAIKKDQKTPRALAKQLIKLKSDYEAAVKSGALVEVPPPQEK